MRDGRDAEEEDIVMLQLIKEIHSMSHHRVPNWGLFNVSLSQSSEDADYI